MSIPIVPKTDSVDIWRQKTNLIAELEGDLDLLLTTDKTSLVAAINEVLGTVGAFEQDALIRAIAVSGG